MKFLDYDFVEVKDHRELFGRKFAKHGKFSVGFGSVKPSADNPVDIQWEFTAPEKTVKEVSYYSGSYVTNGGFVLIISDHLGADKDDAGVVGFVEIENGKTSHRLSMFVNAENVDPKPPMVRDSTQPSAYARPRTTWLESGKTYYGRLYRTDLRKDGIHPAMTLETAAS
jgi:hypothetical protein